MNILDHTRTPLWQVWERVRELADRSGTALADSELIGLLPRAALEDVAEHAGLDASEQDDRLRDAAAWLAIRDFSLGRVLEIRLRDGS
jgi:glutamate formiminotransferase